MNLDELKYIMTIAEEGSFSKAAERLFVAQSSLSQTVLKLEKQYSANFFKRTSRGAELSASGEILVKYAQMIVDLLNCLKIDLNELNKQDTKSISVSTITNHARYFFHQTLPHIKKLYPYISINLSEESVDCMEKQLLSGEVDVAVMRLPIKYPDIEYTVLGNEKFFIMMNIDNPLTKRAFHIDGYRLPFIDIRLLADQPFLLFPANDAIAKAINPVFGNAGFFPKNAIEVRPLELHEKLCEDTDYVTITPKPLWTEIGHNAKVAYFNIEQQYSMPFTLIVANAKKTLPGHVRQYIDLIIEHNEFSQRGSRLKSDNN